MLPLRASFKGFLQTFDLNAYFQRSTPILILQPSVPDIFDHMVSYLQAKLY